MTRKLFCSVVLVACMSVAAQAVLIGSPKIVLNDSTTVPGFVVNDIRIEFTGQWFSGQLLTNGLEPGDIKQDTAATGGVNFHTPFLSLQDSFISNGGLGITDPNNKAIIEVGPAVNLDATDAATRPKVFNTEKIDFAWSAGTGASPSNETDWLIAHLVLSETANGTFKIMVSSTGENVNIKEGMIVDGVMSFGVIPEPATMALMGLGGLALIRRRRN